ncbi:MAG: universal stress protein [Candidatus Promineifilaceae bacterium]|nr:universal stress protein [Candidatus Promineifilaceae bacterium]
MTEQNYKQALRDFRSARQQAVMRQLLSRFSGEANDLLAYNEIADDLKVEDTVELGLQEIPLEAIIGSVGRAEDFTRDFLPKRDSDAERWARVRAAVSDMRGWPPIEVYKLGNVYFVKDGNHRVSVARQLGNETISARVTEVKTRLEVDMDADPSEIISRASYLRFLEETKLDESRPDSDLYLTFCNHYESLIAQIDNYRYELSARESNGMSFEEAAARWYDDRYLPVADLIRTEGTLRNFEKRTEADIYVLLSERRHDLEEALGWEVSAQSAIAGLDVKHENRLGRAISRFRNRLTGILRPEIAAHGPPPGEWRRSRHASTRDQTLFADILVSLQGTEADWRLLDETIRVAQWEQGRILALHAVDSVAELDGELSCQIRKRFYERCASAGVEGQFACEVGLEGDLLIARAPWADLVTTNLTFATEYAPRSNLSKGVSDLIKRCPRPILVIAGETRSGMDHALLAYDGSPKADEALFVTTYLALRYNIKLSVVTVRTEFTTAAALERARDYLTGHHLVNVQYVVRNEPIYAAIAETAASLKTDFLIMGGFGFRTGEHIHIGSTVDDALRKFDHPILICR